MTLSANGGTGSISITFESQPLVCLDDMGNSLVPNPILGTFTLDPPPDAPHPVIETTSVPIMPPSKTPTRNARPRRWAAPC